MLADYFQHTVTVSRSVVTGNKTTYAQVGAAFASHIQPMSESYSQDSMGRGGKSFKMFSTSEVRIGDRIVDQDGIKYECYGIKHLTFRGKSHYEASLRGV